MLKIMIKRLFYEDKDLLSNVDLAVQPAERILIVGQTGQGKSSLLNTLNLMNQNYDGKILFEGKDLREYAPYELRSQICMVMQEPFLGEGTVRDILQEPFHFSANKHNQNPKREQQTLELFENFKLSASYLDKNTELLSGGEKQRIALIRILLLKPKILLLDEISSALDQKTSGIISDCIFKNYPGAVIAISHDPLWQERWQRSWKLENGKIIDSKEL
ncbi:MAG: ATP-binding cassette domain-containing protein [Candidatus Cloacimonetes bacterium]|nr:ATP-binding cassette domain-containing protein [Candidatus Cloacimonadota bacterium]MDY0298514.1 ATP-binding cassette domain-containing protein [Candidatus Cloacimonadaceae bacterium]MCK9333058.1 ATP-binding cassette domain-containing protein [Candidatus Cloacimonadota bacterium]MDD2209715.1 ATP-binding cassette domain-containing protein [Candidatus Cloacimonadota bacterium]MDD3283353.1 ATP-binding cassette domain-containing protein [Candidatus Cloacimonadota bacterium]